MPRSSRRSNSRGPPETQTAVVWSCLPFIRSGQNHLARQSERGKKTRQTKEEVGRQHQGMDRPGVRQVPEGSEEQGKMEKTGCKIICCAPTPLAVKGLMMMMMMMMLLEGGILHVKIGITIHCQSYFTAVIKESERVVTLTAFFLTAFHHAIRVCTCHG